LETVRSNLRKASDKTGKISSIVFAILLSLGLGAGCWFLYDILKVQWAIPLVVSSGGIGAIWSKLRRWCRTQVTSTIYARKLKEAGLGDKWDRVTNHLG
jgi:hypothetical protein